MTSRKKCAKKLLSFILAIGCATGTTCAISLPAGTWQAYAAETSSKDSAEGANETTVQTEAAEIDPDQEIVQNDVLEQETAQPGAAEHSDPTRQETEQTEAIHQESELSNETGQSVMTGQEVEEPTETGLGAEQSDMIGQEAEEPDKIEPGAWQPDTISHETDQTEITDQNNIIDQDVGEGQASASADTDAADKAAVQTSGRDSSTASQTPVTITDQTTTSTASVTTPGETINQKTEAAESATDTPAVKSTTATTKKVTLDKPANLCWENVTVLYWDKVKDADKYQIVLTVRSGSFKYSKKITVKGKNSCDLENQIVSIIKAHKTKFRGAAYTVTAKVSALSSNTKNFKNSKVVSSPTIRYLRTTYDEAVSRNGWYEKEGDWFFYEKGKKQAGWITFQNKRYYLDEEGKLLTDRWVGRRYLKSNGEMARDEWVDDYKFYVNKKGLKVSSVKYSTKNWIETKKGWRYKESGGGYVKNTWKTINHRVYYFDKKGYMKTGWFKVGNKKYHLKATGEIKTGLGARETGWVKAGKNYYWCDDKGVLAANQWVDRSQYYVGSKGKRVNTLTYQNLRNVSTSNRLGYFVYQKDSPPEQSIDGYDLAYRNGNRIFVADLRFTKDNIPVCFHDDLVTYARDKNGRIPSAAPSVSGCTMQELSRFDYGVYRGADYRGTQPLTLKEMAKWIKSHKDADLYVEVKADKMSAAQISGVVKILKKYGIIDRTSMVFNVTSASDTRAHRVHKAAPTMRIGLTSGAVNNTVLKQAAKAKGSKNDVFLYCWGVNYPKWSKTKLSAAAVQKLRGQDISYECGTFRGKNPIDAIMRYYAVATPYIYNSGVETEGAVFKNELMEATCHEKAKWVKSSRKFKYQLVDRTYAKSTWITSGKKKYYVNSAGCMVTGWLRKGGKRYYMGADGVMVTGNRTIDGKNYKFGKGGALVK